eukprot:2377616-Rhodomonas_salina.1
MGDTGVSHNDTTNGEESRDSKGLALGPDSDRTLSLRSETPAQPRSTQALKLRLDEQSDRVGGLTERRRHRVHRRQSDLVATLESSLLHKLYCTSPSHASGAGHNDGQQSQHRDDDDGLSLRLRLMDPVARRHSGHRCCKQSSSPLPLSLSQPCAAPSHAPSASVSEQRA